MVLRTTVCSIDSPACSASSDARRSVMSRTVTTTDRTFGSWRRLVPTTSTQRSTPSAPATRNSTRAWAAGSASTRDQASAARSLSASSTAAVGARPTMAAAGNPNRSSMPGLT